jgi:hypothetical protein
LRTPLLTPAVGLSLTMPTMAQTAASKVEKDGQGAAEFSCVAGDVGMAIDALGLKGKVDHTTGETADLRLLPIQITRAAVLLYRLTR